MNENPSGSKILAEILQGLGVENSNSGYQHLSEVLEFQFGVMVTSDELRALGQQSPIHPVLEAIGNGKWPWMYASDEEWERFHKTLREVAQQAGLRLRNNK
ncbi:MAG: hypothetical protein ACT4QB_04030 [Gammaproteobacteria bacterium]